MKLVNLGCSFSYGNCVSDYETLSEEHIGPGTLIAKHLDYEEVNLASPGLSLDGVLRRLYTFDFDRNSTFLVGLEVYLDVIYTIIAMISPKLLKTLYFPLSTQSHLIMCMYS